MLTPSILLTDEGDGAETVTIHETDFETTDPSGNFLPNPSESGTVYPAVVNPTNGSLLFDNSSDESANSYDIVLYSIDNPHVLVDTRLIWSRDNTPMIAQGAAIPVGRGAWGFRASVEIQEADEPLYRPGEDNV